MQVEHIYRFPVKGLSPEALEMAELLVGQTIPHDRRFALAQGDAPFDPAAPRFLPKQNFACMMANPKVVLVRSAFDPVANQLFLAGPDMEPMAADPTTEEGRAALGAWLTRFLGDEARGTPRFLDVPGHAFTDQVKKCVSLINIASLRDFEEKIGRRLDLLRFRGNVYFSGLPAWAEMEWVGKTLQLGSAKVKIFKTTIRCPATKVDLETGVRDCEVPDLLFQHYGHRDLGVHAEVLEDGKVFLGDGLEVLD
ncbi:MOSC domain-containing protein [Rhodovarius crocodyli]|uniref:MOSC domain-containing protein n=1 Tax=Rhodovarius crocodyli TaxID=1979269 RepID=A0A437MPQ1_9PROT|nr:MOSC N-terminal beta barrel domain-containing protein [Rhodovarius crocodyli]RVT99618.1 MOSC domain-containing protein [Rhodovarius crocodyli]